MSERGDDTYYSCSLQSPVLLRERFNRIKISQLSNPSFWPPKDENLAKTLDDLSDWGNSILWNFPSLTVSTFWNKQILDTGGRRQEAGGRRQQAGGRRQEPSVLWLQVAHRQTGRALIGINCNMSILRFVNIPQLIITSVKQPETPTIILS